jgi:hypothetical protein
MADELGEVVDRVDQASSPKPSKLDRRKPRAALIWPNTGSTICLRRRERERRRRA